MKGFHQNGGLEESDASSVNSVWSFCNIKESFICVTVLGGTFSLLDSSVKFELLLVMRVCVSESSLGIVWVEDSFCAPVS